jgi:hypothetical protein
VEEEGKKWGRGRKEFNGSNIICSLLEWMFQVGVML